MDVTIKEKSTTTKAPAETMQKTLDVVPSKKRRVLNIREVSNGYVLRLEINANNPNGPASSQYNEQEMVVINLPSLLKKVKVFFQDEIVDDTAEGE